MPQEDQGYIFVPYFLPDSASLDRTHAVGTQAAAIMHAHPAVANVSQVDGYSLIDSQIKTNFGVLFVALKDYEERQSPELSARRGDRRRRSAGSTPSRAAWWCRSIRPPFPGSASPPASRSGSSRRAPATSHSSSDVVEQIIAKAKTRPELAGVNTTIRANGQQLLADVDREKAEVLGVPVQDAYDTLQTMFGSLYVSQFPKDSRLYQVVLQAEPKYRMTPEDIGQFYVKNREGR